MKIKDLNLSEYTYKRVCVYDENQTFYPIGKESLLLEKHGEKDLAVEPETDEFGWLILTIKI